MKKYNRIHFVGVGGIGISALAKLMKSRGVYVSGSDLVDSEILGTVRRAGVQVWKGPAPKKMGKDIELVVYSGAVPEDNEERIRGRHLGAREVVYNEFLAEVSEEYTLVAVTGTHGKSTTTSMLGRVLIDAGLSPTVVVGSQVTGFNNGNLHIGKGEIFLVEACEYKAHMNLLRPNVGVVTNIEFDHPDFYRDLEHVGDEMGVFMRQIVFGGALVWNADDFMSAKVVDGVVRERCDRPDECDLGIVSFGDGGDVYAEVVGGNGEQILTVFRDGEKLGDVLLRVPGAYNVQNALGVIAAAMMLGVGFDVIAKSLGEFEGIWRRFERLGFYGGFEGVDVYSDYAHHPTALVSLLDGVKSFLPGRRVVMCFEPHQHARTRGLFDEFVASFDGADVLILSEIYGVAGRAEGEGIVSSGELVEAVLRRDAERGVEREVLLAGGLDQVKGVLDGVLRDGDVLLMTGAGDIDALARKFV